MASKAPPPVSQTKEIQDPAGITLADDTEAVEGKRTMDDLRVRAVDWI